MPQPNPRFRPGVPLVCVASAAIGLFGCTSTPETTPAEADAGRHSHLEALTKKGLPMIVQAMTPPPSGEGVRVGGDLVAQTLGENGHYKCGWSSVDTPLPAGYPRPTPPGALELKTYPAVRIAEVAGAGDPDGGMNRTFWPLFNHIKKHDIAMTSPVQMQYAGMGAGGKAQPDAWSMAFVYRTADMNGTGTEGSVTVRDAEPVTVIAIGVKGDYSMALVERGMRALEDWLAANPQWQAAGDGRALYYNGPSLLFWNKWAEVQLPVRPTPGAGVQTVEGTHP